MLEQTQEIVQSFNHTYGEVLVEQKAYSHQKEWVDYLESMEMAK